MKRLVFGITLPLVMGSWILVQYADIFSKSVSAVTHAYGAFNEMYDRLPAKAATLRLWLPIGLGPGDPGEPQPEPAPSCTLQGGRGSRQDDPGFYFDPKEPQFSFVTFPFRPRFSTGPSRKPPIRLLRGPLLAAFSDESNADSLLYRSSWISSSPRDNVLALGLGPRTKRPFCSGMRTL
jgi:hypothetical protein